MPSVSWALAWLSFSCLTEYTLPIFVNERLLLRPPHEYLTQTSSQGHLQRASNSLICTSKTLTGSGLQLSYLPAALVPRHLTLSFDRSAACLHVSSRFHQAIRTLSLPTKPRYLWLMDEYNVNDLPETHPLNGLII